MIAQVLSGWLLAIVLVTPHGQIRETTGERTYTNQHDCLGDIMRAQMIPLKRGAKVYYWCRRTDPGDWD